MKNYFPIMLIVFIVFSSCKKDDDLTNSGPYTIQGVFYDTDGITPIPNKVLRLSAYMGGSFGGANVSWPAECTTDENGNYKFTYSHNEDYYYMQIEQPANVHPVLGPFLREIPSNKCIRRNVCIGTKNRIEIKVKLNRALNESDTLFVDNLGYKTTNDTIYPYDLGGGKDPIYIYIYTIYKQPPNNTWIIQSGFHNNYFPKDFSIRWGLGRENFEKAIRLQIGDNSGSKEYNVIRYPVKSFPDTTFVTIEVG